MSRDIQRQKWIPTQSTIINSYVSKRQNNITLQSLLHKITTHTNRAKTLYLNPDGKKLRDLMTRTLEKTR